MRVIAIVNALTGALCVQEMVDQGDEVVAVVCDPGDPNPHLPEDWSVKRVADRNYLPVYQPVPKEINKPGFVAAMRKLDADMIVAMHFGVIFKPPLLSAAPKGAVNMHPTRLPRGQGMTPSCWHMIMGDTLNWMTLHWIDPGIDTGDVIDQVSVEIAPEDTGHDASVKVLRAGHQMFAKNLPLLREGKAPRIPQNQIPVEQLYYRWEPRFARIDWDQPAEKIAYFIRALAHPKWVVNYSSEAFSMVGGVKLKVWQGRAVERLPLFACDALPGEVIALAGEGILVKAREGGILLTDVDLDWEGPQGVQGFLSLVKPGIPTILN